MINLFRLHQTHMIIKKNFDSIVNYNKEYLSSSTIPLQEEAPFLQARNFGLFGCLLLLLDQPDIGVAC